MNNEIKDFILDKLAAERLERAFETVMRVFCFIAGAAAMWVWG